MSGRDESSWDGPRPSSSSGRDEINFKLWGRGQDENEVRTRQGRLEDEMRTRTAQIMNITFLIRDINHPVEDQKLDFLFSKIEFLHFLSSAFRSFRPFGDQSSHILNF